MTFLVSARGSHSRDALSQSGIPTHLKARGGYSSLVHYVSLILLVTTLVFVYGFWVLDRRVLVDSLLMGRTLGFLFIHFWLQVTCENDSRNNGDDLLYISRPLIYPLCRLDIVST